MIKKVLKISIIISLCFVVHATYALENFSSFLENIYQKKESEEPLKWSAVARETLIIYEDEDFDEFKSKTISLKKYIFEDGDFTVDVIEEDIIGDPPKFGEHGGKSGEPDDQREPFRISTSNEYSYNDYGEITLLGKSTRKIGFKAKIRDDKHFDGQAWFEPETHNIVRMTLSYADPPKAIKYFQLDMSFKYIDQYRFTNKFHMQMSGKALIFIHFNVEFKQALSEIEIIEE